MIQFTDIRCFLVTGMVYPAFGVVYAKGIDAFSKEGKELRHAGDRVALWLFIIALVSTVSIGFQNYLFASAAATLTAKLRSLSFRAILRQDSTHGFYHIIVSL